MKDALNKPAPKFGPGAGLLRNDLFQIAYCTNDVERARAIFAERFGVTAFHTLNADLAAGGKVRIELGWAGGVMYEIVRGEGPGAEIYTKDLPSDRFAMRHHHIGFFVPTEAAFDAIEREIAADGYEVVIRSDSPGFVKVVMIDAPELGHYLEYIFPREKAYALYEGAPSN